MKEDMREKKSVKKHPEQKYAAYVLNPIYE
jgi:hypothetical protein